MMAAATLTACQKSLEERAEQEAREYTRKYCPTPIDNFSRTDSMVFDKANRTYIYYCTLTDQMDNKEIIDSKKDSDHLPMFNMSVPALGFLFVFQWSCLLFLSARSTLRSSYSVCIRCMQVICF